MRLLVTGGSGVLGRALRPLADAAGHDVRMPSSNELDVFDPVAVAAASRDVDAVLHLATRIQSLELISQPDAWWENDRLRADASRILVDAALAAGVEVYFQPTVTFVYPPRGAVSEDTPPTEVIATLRSALRAEQETDRFARAGRRGVVLRLGLLDGPGTANERPNRTFGATVHVADAGRALLAAPSPSRAGSTTSAVIVSASLTTASQTSPAGIRRDSAIVRLRVPSHVRPEARQRETPHACPRPSVGASKRCTRRRFCMAPHRDNATDRRPGRIRSADGLSPTQTSGANLGALRRTITQLAKHRLRPPRGTSPSARPGATGSDAPRSATRRRTRARRRAGTSTHSDRAHTHRCRRTARP